MSNAGATEAEHLSLGGMLARVVEKDVGDDWKEFSMMVTFKARREGDTTFVDALAMVPVASVPKGDGR